jgi:hypothetical protein
VCAGSGLGAFSAGFSACDDGYSLAGCVKRQNGVFDGLLGGFQLAHGRRLSRCHGSWLHNSDADQAELVQTLERRRGVHARTFDDDEPGSLEAHDRGIEIGLLVIPQSMVHALALSSASSSQDIQDHQVFCALHWR